ncbi:MAG: hypothetical protein QOE25_1217 [Actinomycetota bacterium]|nr:hypothetical protein [Actinomycetota bacterium]
MRLRPALGRDGRLPAPRHLAEVSGFVNDAGFVMLRPDRCVIAKELYWGNGRRPKPEDQTALEIFTALSLESEVVLDIGAYTGIFTLAAVAADPNLHAHAFEIVPAVAEALRMNVERNGVSERVTIHQVGVGEEGTSVILPVGHDGSALPDFYSTRLTFSDGVEVPVRSLDALTEAIPAEARAVMKIDVEGTEAEILQQGARFLSTNHPDILCEVLHGVGDGPALEAVLGPLGYRYYLVEESGVRRSDRIVPSTRFRDWLFTTRTEEDLDGHRIGVSS